MNSDRLFFDRDKAQNIVEYSKEIPENLRNVWGKLQKPNNWKK
ncbi:hypothetical protein [Okeania sp. SIO2C9]|nr:hypothetical protein [Okeania sp. SIO2C9]